MGDRGYGMGVACADYDADGDIDLYVTNLGANVLYRNEGNGLFVDLTAESGTGGSSWSTTGRCQPQLRLPVDSFLIARRLLISE